MGNPNIFQTPFHPKIHHLHYIRLQETTLKRQPTIDGANSELFIQEKGNWNLPHNRLYRVLNLALIHKVIFVLKGLLQSRLIKIFVCPYVVVNCWHMEEFMSYNVGDVPRGFEDSLNDFDWNVCNVVCVYFLSDVPYFCDAVV